MAITAKTSTKHPYLAIEHRVVDSLAFADLTYSASTLLMLLARQLTKDNNGHLQATYSYMRRFGFSENTLSRAIAELISHGLIYRTRSGGYQQGAAQYAVTWRSITRREGLFLAGFKACAWRDWQPTNKKIPPSKLRRTHRKNDELTPATPPKFEVDSPPKTEGIELIPCMSSDCSTTTNALTDRGSNETHDSGDGSDSDSISFTRDDDDEPAEFWDCALGEHRTPKAKVEVTKTVYAGLPARARENKYGF